jgi:hypothetical protein
MIAMFPPEDDYEVYCLLECVAVYFDTTVHISEEYFQPLGYRQQQ